MTPSLFDDPSARKKVVTAVGDYYEQLAATTTEFVAKLVRGTFGAEAERDATPPPEGSTES